MMNFFEEKLSERYIPQNGKRIESENLSLLLTIFEAGDDRLVRFFPPEYHEGFCGSIYIFSGLKSEISWKKESFLFFDFFEKRMKFKFEFSREFFLKFSARIFF